MKKLILILIVAFAGVAYADDPAQKQQEQACYDLLNKDPAFADSIKHTIDKTLDQRIVDTHNDAFHHVQKNEKHVVYAYAALWVIAAAFLVFLWRRQQGLRSEIAQLRADLAAAGKDPT